MDNIQSLQMEMTPSEIGVIRSVFRGLSAPGPQLQQDEMSPAFTSLSLRSQYGITRPKATFRPIKTYFASCLLDCLYWLVSCHGAAGLLSSEK